jgi:hypothetical protein
MPLRFTGEWLPTINSKDYRAFGSRENELIIVEASHEALHDYGETAVKQRANDKYDAQQIQNNRITVRTSDFR